MSSPLVSLEDQVRQHGFGAHEGGISSERVRRWINQAYQQLATDAPGSWLEFAVSPPVSGGVAALPADLRLLRAVTYQGRALGSLSFADYLDRADDYPSGAPQHFSVFANQIYLTPVPSGSGGLAVFYTRRPPALAVDSDIPLVPPAFEYLIVLGAVIRGYRETNEDQRAQLLEAEYAEEIKTAQADLGAGANIRSAGSADDTLSALRQTIRDHGFDLGDPMLTGFLNDALLDVAGRADWPFLRDKAVVAVSAGVPKIELPADCMRPLALYDDQGNRLRYDNISQRLHEDPYSGAERLRGEPTTYALYGSQEARLAPVPSRSASYTLYYLREPEPLAEVGDVAPFPTRRHRRVILYAALAMAAEATARQANADGSVSGAGIQARMNQAAAFRAEFEQRVEHMKEDFLREQLDQDDHVLEYDEPEDEY